MVLEIVLREVDNCVNLHCISRGILKHAILITALIISMTVASAATITVDDSGGADYTSIQSAVDNASAGDTIVVRSGNYYENVNITKQLTLQGVDTGVGRPIVDGRSIGNVIEISVNEVTLENFIISNSSSSIGYGISIISDDNVLKNNTISDNLWAFYLIDSNNNTLNGNIIFNNSNGIYLESSTQNVVSKNNIINHYIGIDLYGSEFNTITDNVVKLNTTLSNWAGIQISSSSNNTIYGNNITNYNWGIYISPPSSTFSNNLIYQNNLGNNENALDLVYNQWDNDIIGNHWDNFDEPFEGCLDIDNNDICDLPFKIPNSSSFPGFGLSYDRYPSITWTWPPSVILEHFPPSPSNLVNSTGVYWVNHTWEAGLGNITDSYNISVNGFWTNSTTQTFYFNDVGPGNWSNITVYAYNALGSGSLSSPVSQNTQAPMAPVPIYIPPSPLNLTNTTGNYWINHTWEAGSGNITDSYNISVNGLWTNDTTQTFYYNDVGPGNWSNITVYAYNASGGGSLSAPISQNTRAPEAPVPIYTPPAPVNLTNTTGNYWINHTWEAGSGNITDSYNISVNGLWTNDTTQTFYFNDIGPGNWSNITVYAYNASGGGSLSSPISQNTQAPEALFSADDYFPRIQNSELIYRWNNTIYNPLILNENCNFSESTTLNCNLQSTDGTFNIIKTSNYLQWAGYSTSGSDPFPLPMYMFFYYAYMPNNFLKNNFSIGDQWAGSGTFVGTESYTATTYVLGWEFVDVPAGNFNTIKLKTEFNSSNSYLEGTRYIWLAENVGIVRLLYQHLDGSVTYGELKEFGMAGQSSVIISPNPINLTNTTGNYWINHTWKAGSGNITDSYNISVNGLWTNDTTQTFYFNDVGPGNWSNITVYAYNASGSGSLSSPVSQNTQAPILVQLFDNWNPLHWNLRKRISVNNIATQTLVAESTIDILFDHASLVAAGKSLKNGSDIRVVWYNSTENRFTEIDRINLNDWNNSNTVIAFKIQTDILSGEIDDNYLLYYGYLNASNPPNNPEKVYFWYEDFDDYSSINEVLNYYTPENGNFVLQPDEDGGNKLYQSTSYTGQQYYLHLNKNASSSGYEVITHHSNQMTWGGQGMGVTNISNPYFYRGNEYSEFSWASHSPSYPVALTLKAMGPLIQSVVETSGSESDWSWSKLKANSTNLTSWYGDTFSNHNGGPIWESQPRNILPRSLYNLGSDIHFKWFWGNSYGSLDYITIRLMTDKDPLISLSSEQNTTGLVAEYHFDNNTIDSSGNGNNGTNNGATFVDGISGKALSFDGVNDYINCGNDGSLDLTDEITYEALIKRSGGFDTIQVIITKNSLFANQYGAPTWYFDTSNRVAFVIQQKATMGTSNTAILDTNWHHIAITKDSSGNWKWYIDGNLDRSEIYSTTIESNSENLYIGAGDIWFFNGLIDEVRIYNRSLTAGEIILSYEEFISPPYITSFSPQSPVNDTEYATRTFNITIEQVVNVTWLINDSEVLYQTNTTESSYTNPSAALGIWNVSAIVSNTNGTDMQMWIWNVTSMDFIPPTPVNLTNTTSNYWVNNTWEAGFGNITDSYNISVNGLWTNSTTQTFYYNDVGPGNWSNITVYAYNASGIGTLSQPVSQNTQVTQEIENIIFHDSFEDGTLGEWNYRESGGSEIVSQYNYYIDDSDAMINKDGQYASKFVTENAYGGGQCTAGAYQEIYKAIDFSNINNLIFNVMTYDYNVPGVLYYYYVNIDGSDVWVLEDNKNHSNTYVSQTVSIDVSAMSGNHELRLGKRCWDNSYGGYNIAHWIDNIKGLGKIENNHSLIISFTPQSPVNDTEGATRTFNITTDQTVNATWLINGSDVFNQTDVTESSYTNTSAALGIWNVSAIVSNANGTDMQTWIWNVTSMDFIPPAPINFSNTSGEFWVNHTWLAGSGNVTDSYNVSVNGEWYNSTHTYYYDDIGPGNWSNITVYAYNASGTGTLSSPISQNTQAPEAPIPTYNPPVPANLANTTGNYWVNHTWEEGSGNITDSYNVSVNGQWHNSTQTYYYDDVGPGNWSNITVYAYNASGSGTLSSPVSQNTQAPEASVPTYTPPSPTNLANTTGNYWVNHTWSAGIGNITDSYNVSVNGQWHNSTQTYYYDDVGPGNWSNITVYAYNVSGNGSLSSPVFQNTQAPAVGPSIITVDDSGGADYTSIQAAVDNATAEDTIEVRSGIYYENVDVNKQLILRGVDIGSGKPVVDANGNGNAITLNANGITLDGFTTINASGYPFAGIRIVSNNNILSNNTASDNSLYGIYLFSSSNNNTLSNNTAANNTNGIYLFSSSNNMLSGNTASNNNYSGITLVFSSSNNTLRSNTALNNSNAGIYMSSSNNTLSGNTASNNGIYGIYMSSSNDNTLSNNTVSNNSQYGIRLESSSNNMLSNNTGSNNFDGIFLVFSSNNNTLSNNTASKNSYSGISLVSSCNNNTLIGNTASNNSYGINLAVSNNNTLSINTVSNNSNKGIKLENSGSKNIIYYNNLINNNPASYVNNNQWDNGTIGNHYSNYDEPAEGCSDSNSDSICDSGYTIPGGSDNIDRYPLVSWNIPAPAAPYIPPVLINLTNTTGNYWVNHTWSAGSGNITDSYNVSINGLWLNGTTDTYYNNSVGPYGWSNISVWAYNNSGSGSLSLIPISQNTQVVTNTPPFIYLLDPQNNSIINDCNQTINLSIIDENIDYVWYTHEDNNILLQFPYMINVSNWDDGIHVLDIWAEDVEGLSNHSIFNFTIDFARPNITEFYSFPKAPFNNEAITFIVHVSDESEITVSLEYSLDFGETYQSVNMIETAPSIYSTTIGPFNTNSSLIKTRVLASDGEKIQNKELFIPIRSDTPSLTFNYRSPVIDGILSPDKWQIENLEFNGVQFNETTSIENIPIEVSYSRNSSHIFTAFRLNASHDSLINISGYFDSSPDAKLTLSNTDGFEISFDNNSILEMKDVVYENASWTSDIEQGGENNGQARVQYQNGTYTLEITKPFNTADNLDNNANTTNAVIIIDILSNDSHQYLIWPGMTHSGLIPNNESDIESYVGYSNQLAPENWGKIHFSNKLNVKISNPFNYQMFSRGEKIYYNVSVFDLKQNFVNTSVVYATVQDINSSTLELQLYNNNSYQNNFTIPSNSSVGIKDLKVNSSDEFGNYGGTHSYVFTFEAYIASISLNKTILTKNESILFDIYVSRPNDRFSFLNDSQVIVSLEIIDVNNNTVIPINQISSIILENNAVFEEIVDTTGLSNGIYTAQINISDSNDNLIEYHQNFKIIEDYSISVSIEKNVYERNTPVNISGVIQYNNGTFASSASVNIELHVKGFKRRFSTITNETGRYNYEFIPFETEAGKYELTVVTNINGLVRNSQTNFTIKGIIFSSEQINLETVKGTSDIIPLKIINVGETVLNNISISINDTNLTDEVSASLIGWSSTNLNGGEEKLIEVQVNSSLNSPRSAAFELMVNSSEGAKDTTNINVQLYDGNPYININPDLIKLNINPGKSVIRTISISNTGYGILENATIVPPEEKWILLQTNQTLGNLLPNEIINFDVLIFPQENTSIGRYINNITIKSSNYPDKKIWIDVSILSSNNGSITFHITDKYLNTNISSANVTLISQAVEGLFFENVSDNNGYVIFQNIPTGSYSYRVIAEKYDIIGGVVEVEPTLENVNNKTIEIILTPTWLGIGFNVTPTLIEDEYNISLELTLDAEVPIPVIQAIPNKLSYVITPGTRISNQTIDLINLGLTSVKNLKISTNTDSGVKIDLLSDSLSELKAKKKTQIPFDISLNSTTAHGIQIINYVNISGEFLYSKDGAEAMVPLNELSIPVYVTVPIGDLQVTPNQIRTVLEPGEIYESEFVVKNMGLYQIDNIQLTKNVGDSDIIVNLMETEIPILAPEEERTIKYNISVLENSDWDKSIYTFINITGTENEIDSCCYMFAIVCFQIPCCQTSIRNSFIYKVP
ncbi:MAG: hypothetical protein E4G94_00010, partial [ANME-2 cluster archaeon]